MNNRRVPLELLVLAVALVCLEPGVYPVSGRPAAALELFRQEASMLWEAQRAGRGRHGS